MARKKKLSLAEAYETHKSTGNNSFFTLEDDGDTAVVRFLYSNEDEFDYFLVHEAEIEGKKRWVDCTEEDGCPMCKKKAPQLKLFIQMAVKNKEDVQTWERGQTMMPKFIELFHHYGDLTQHLFEIERKGAKNDSNTTYEIHHIEESPIDHKVLPERQDFYGTDYILEKTHEEMEEILAGNAKYERVDTSQQQRRTPLGGGGKKEVELF